MHKKNLKKTSKSDGKNEENKYIMVIAHRYWGRYHAKSNVYI